MPESRAAEPEPKQSPAVVVTGDGVDPVHEVDEAGLPAVHGGEKAPLDDQEISHFWKGLTQKLLLNSAETKLIWAINVPMPEGVRGFPPGRVEAINKSAADMAYHREAISLDLDAPPGNVAKPPSLTGLPVLLGLVCGRFQQPPFNRPPHRSPGGHASDRVAPAASQERCAQSRHARKRHWEIAAQSNQDDTRT